MFVSSSAMRVVDAMSAQEYGLIPLAAK